MPTLNQTRGKLVGFAFLPPGWNFNKGVPAKELPLKIALALLDALDEAGFHYTDAYPGIDGGIMLSAYSLPDYYDFNIKPSGSITVEHGQGDKELFYQPTMAAKDVYDQIKEFALQKWHTSESLTSEITIAGNSNDLKVTLSRTQKTDQASQSLTSSALGEPLVASASIAQDFTPQLRGRQSSSGKFRMRSLQTVGV